MYFLYYQIYCNKTWYYLYYLIYCNEEWKINFLYYTIYRNVTCIVFIYVIKSIVMIMFGHWGAFVLVKYAEINEIPISHSFDK